METEFAMKLAGQGYPVAFVPFLDLFIDDVAFEGSLQSNPDTLVNAVEAAVRSAVDTLPSFIENVVLAAVGTSGSVVLETLRGTLEAVKGIVAVAPSSLTEEKRFGFDGRLAVFHGDANKEISSADLFDFEDKLRAAEIPYEITRYSTAQQSILSDPVAWARVQASIQTFLDVVFRPKALEYITEPMFSTNVDNSLIEGQYLEYTEGQEAYRGYIAFPQEASQKALPLLIIGPDWDGIGEYEIWRAKLIAQMGYVAFVADIYGQGVEQGSSLPIDRRSRLATTYSGQSFIPRALAAINAALETDLVEVDAENIALVGYCFGASGMLNVARTEIEGLKGVVAFHPGLVLSDVPSALGCYRLATLVLNGADDSSISEKDIEAFRREFNTKKSIWEWTNYGGARHAFTEPDIPRDGNFSAYNPYADVRSFASLTSFLVEIFTPDDTSIYTHCE